VNRRPPYSCADTNGNLVNPTNRGRGMAEKRDKTNWLLWAVLGIVIYLGIVGNAIGLDKLRAFFTDTTALNNIGDFLAGIFAVPAFLLLAAAVLTQRQELIDARDQFDDSREVTAAQLGQIEKQNKLAHKAAQANYKLAIFDKRMAVYAKLQECSLAIIADRMLDEKTREMFYTATESANFVFGDDITKYVTELRERHTDFYIAEHRIRYFEKKRQSVPLSIADESNLDASSDLKEKVNIWLMNNFTFAVLEEKFTPSLKLPVDIAADDEKV